MLVEKLDDLVDQPLTDWHLERWYAIYKGIDSYGVKKLIGYCRYAGSIKFLEKKQNQRPQTGRPVALSNKSVNVLTNGTTFINLKSGKKIVQTNEFARADTQAAEDDRLRKQALDKLSAAEKRALGLV